MHHHSRQGETPAGARSIRASIDGSGSVRSESPIESTRCSSTRQRIRHPRRPPPGSHRKPDGRLLLEGRRSRRRCDLKRLFVLQAIRSPGHGLKPALFDRSTAHDALAERAIGHAAQRLAHLSQHGRIVFGFGEFLGRHLARDARFANVMGRVDEFSPALVRFMANSVGQSFFEVEQPLLVVLKCS